MIPKNESGFSLVQVMVGAALLGGLALAFMQLTKNFTQSKNFAQSSTDELELRSTVRMILNDPNYCRLSLAGDGMPGAPTSPVTFKKKSIDEYDKGEGLDVELFYGNQAGDARTKKRLSSTDPLASRFGSITVKSIKLVMNNGVGTNYAQSAAHNDIGQVKIVTEKRVGEGSKRDIIHTFDVNVGMSTSASKTSTILSCSNQPQNDTIKMSGAVAAFAGQPTGAGTEWLYCDGSLVKIAEYPDLYAVIGKTYGGNSTQFRLPDYRGYFLRGVDNGSGRDPEASSRTNRGDGTTGDAVGTRQTDDLKNHNHHPGGDVWDANKNEGSWEGPDYDPSDKDGRRLSLNPVPVGGPETRPKNVSVLYYIHI